MNHLLIAIGAGIAAIGILTKDKKAVDTPAKIVPNVTDDNPDAGDPSGEPETIKTKD